VALAVATYATTDGAFFFSDVDYSILVYEDTFFGGDWFTVFF
jgi:hypothetical protein